MPFLHFIKKEEVELELSSNMGTIINYIVFAALHNKAQILVSSEINQSTLSEVKKIANITKQRTLK